MAMPWRYCEHSPAHPVQCKISTHHHDVFGCIRQDPVLPGLECTTHACWLKQWHATQAECGHRQYSSGNTHELQWLAWCLFIICICVVPFPQQVSIIMDWECSMFVHVASLHGIMLKQGDLLRWVSARAQQIYVYITHANKRTLLKVSLMLICLGTFSEFANTQHYRTAYCFC